MDDFRLGASYYPEWWPEEQWNEDFRKMAELGFNVVRMGEFAWSWYEPREGEYNFEPMRRAVELAGSFGIKTVMCTTSAVCPVWLYKKHPEVKGGNLHGRYDFGGRKGQCLSSDVFLRYVEKITYEQAKALGGNPNIIGWQLDNEPGYPFSDYDDLCEQGFRDWLRRKYVTIDKLNEAWFTMMWSNVYTDFDQVDLPVNAAEGGWFPGLHLDYRRYFSFTFNRLLRMEANIIRQFSKGRFIYTNWPGANWSVDCYEATDYLDYSAWDNYVGQPWGDKYRVQLRASMEHSFGRRLSSGKHAFVVAEQSANVGPNGIPDVISAQTWLNVSHGALATIFFEWRVPTGGGEQGYDSVLKLDGTYNECEHVFRELSADFGRHYPKIAGAVTESDIAAVYSYENSWATTGWTVDGFYDEEFFNAYGGFKNTLRRNVDVIMPFDDMTRYKVVVAPNLKIVTETERDKILKYVENGGVLVINAPCGTRNERNLLRELPLPGLFSDAAGAKMISSQTASKFTQDTGLPAKIKFSGAEVTVNSMLYKFELAPSVETAAVFAGANMDGIPAVTLNKYGCGYIILCGCDGGDVHFYEALADFIKNRFNIEPLARADDGVIISTREKNGFTYLFAVNMKDGEAIVTLDKPYYDERGACEICGQIKLKPYETLFAREL